MNAMGLKNSRRGSKRDKEVRLLTAGDVFAIAKVVPARLGAKHTAQLHSDLNRSITIRNQMHGSMQALASSRNLKRLAKLQKGIKLVTSQILEIWSLSGGYNALRESPSSYRESADIFLEESVKHEFGDLLDLFHEAWDPLRFVLAAAEVQGKRQRTRINGKHHAKSIDGVRYIFVEELAEIYQHTFGAQAPVTRDDPWCYFLAEVLCRCEQKRMNESGAFALWQKVKREKKRETLFLWAEPRIRAKDLQVRQIRRLMRSGILRPSRQSLPRSIRSMA